jgi:hypothetical protein
MEGCPYTLYVMIGEDNDSDTALSKERLARVSPPFLEGREEEGRRCIKKVPQRVGDQQGVRITIDQRHLQLNTYRRPPSQAE